MDENVAQTEASILDEKQRKVLQTDEHKEIKQAHTETDLTQNEEISSEETIEERFQEHKKDI